MNEEQVPESVQKGLEEAKEDKLLDSPEDFSKYVEKPKIESTELEKQIDEELRNIKPENIDKHFDVEKTIVIPSKKNKKLKPRSFYCGTCREYFLEDKADKRPMGFNRAEDGTLLSTSNRFSIFCPSCAKFILIQDPETDAKIKDAIDKVGNK